MKREDNYRKAVGNPKIILNPKLKAYTIIFFAMLIVSGSCKDSGKFRKNYKENKILKPFNPLVWQSGNLFEKGEMVNDLIDRNLLKSISRDSMVKLMGTPDETDIDFCTYLVSGDTTIVRQNYLLLHISIDSATQLVTDYWLSD